MPYHPSSVVVEIKIRVTQAYNRQLKMAI